MKKIAILAVAMALFCACSQQEGPRNMEDFNFGWRFSLGDSPEFVSGFNAYTRAEWAAPDFDDSGWRQLHLPHDWSIEGDFSEHNPSTTSGGALPGGIGWYRKTFKTPEGAGNGRRVAVEFDGVFMNSTVYVNGKEIGTRPYGYSSFSYDITSALNPEGEDNLIAVRCDNAEQPNSRWYAGCGIYRNVRLVTTGTLRVAWSGTYVTTPEISSASATVAAQITLDGSIPEGAVIRNIIRNPKGAVVARGEDIVVQSKVTDDTLTIVKPHFWDIEDTYLYTLETLVSAGGEELDRYETPFGVRTFRFDVDKGFFLNDRPVKLQGVCLHHDMGCIGTAVHFRALQRELQTLKDMGVNAIRTSHNPPAPELLQFADDMGFLVIDEAFDMWRARKTRFDYARFFDEWHERDLTDFIRRDRNHPSVIMWSVGNELGEQGDDDPSLAIHMGELVHSTDPTRPITAGCDQPYEWNNLYKSGIIDVFGINYRTSQYDNARGWYAGTPLYGSETASSLNSRGFYPQSSLDTLIVPEQWYTTYDTPHHQVPAYDNCHAPWSELHEEAWARIRDREWMAGCFVWTGFDYLGEPTPYTWPARSSYFGIVDLAGFPKDIYWMYQSEWTDETVLHVFPHWNWNPGDKVDIWAYYNNADEVELFVNGKSYGRDSKEGEKIHAQWIAVPYEPGEIEVVSYRNGKVVARDSRETTGEPAGIKLTADRSTIGADGYDLSYITIEAVDSEGREVPTANLNCKFSVSGAGELFGVDNGDATDHLSLKGDTKPLFNGKALAVIRSIKGIPGTVRLTVESPLGTEHIDIKVK